MRKLIYGIYPRSERLRLGIGRWERGIIGENDLRQIISEEKDQFYNMMKVNKIDYYTDPLFNWHDIFRPIVASVNGISLGPLTRYFETNTFYRKPIVNEMGEVRNPMEVNDSEYNIPGPVYRPNSSDGYLTFLPGIGTFYSLSQVSTDFDKFKEWIVEVYNQILKTINTDKVFFYEETPRDVELYSSFSQKVFLRIPVNSKSSNIGKLSVYSLITDDPYLSSKFSNLPGYFAVDSMSTKLENDLAEKLKKFVEDFPELLITHNNYLDFLPRKIADKKVELLGGVA